MNQLSRFLLEAMLIGVFTGLFAQNPPQPTEKEISTSDGVWLGFYTKYHFNEKWAYYGEYHVRKKDGFSEMAQIYLRFGATYTIAEYLDFTAGVVLPFYWAPNPEDPNVDDVVPQYRLWQQAVLATPFEHIKVFHQLRTEQRWRRSYVKDSPFELTHRFRYKLTVYVPLNKPAFENHTLFVAAYNEIFIQAGKSIVYNHFEDNRSYVGVGYNLSEQFQIQGGYMLSFRHAGSPFKYEQRHILRLSLYHHMDLHLGSHREERPIPIH
ncbi:DUF2490 domain-containing protein [Ekhidna sp.]|uniref:DUF2490 domain-containing protein n=1 Tax=Ekhidna sp. TaxID=2608089 RepID=UPI003514F93E